MEEDGFTLVELLVTVAIVAILSAVAFPQFQRYRLRAKVTAVIQEFRLLETAFIAYELQNESYPPDVTEGVYPPLMGGLISPSLFSEPTPIGGEYDWEGPSDWPIAGVSIRNSTDITTVADWRLVDRMIDNGNLNTGKFRHINSGYVYVIDENPS